MTPPTPKNLKTIRLSAFLLNLIFGIVFSLIALSYGIFFVLMLTGTLGDQNLHPAMTEGAGLLLVGLFFGLTLLMSLLAILALVFRRKSYGRWAQGIFGVLCIFFFGSVTISLLPMVNFVAQILTLLAASAGVWLLLIATHPQLDLYSEQS